MFNVHEEYRINRKHDIVDKIFADIKFCEMQMRIMSSGKSFIPN